MYHVRAIPTTLILDDNGLELKRMVGVMREDTLYKKMRWIYREIT